MAASIIKGDSVSVSIIDIGNYQAGSEGPYVQKMGRVRIVTIFALKNLTSNADVTIGQVPSDSVPLRNVAVMASDSTGKYVQLEIRTNGSIIAYGYNTTSANLRETIAYFS